MLLLELLPRLQNSNTTPVVKSLHWLKVSERIEYKIILSQIKFSIPLSYRISMTLYLFSLLVVTTHALRLMSLSSNHHHHSKSFTAPSDILHLIFGTSFLHHSWFLIHIVHPLSATFIWICRFNLLYTHCYHLPSLFHCFTLSSKLTCSENLILHLVCFCLSDWSHGSEQFAGSTCLSVFYVLVVFFSVLVIPMCDRQTWRALWSTFGRTII